MWLSARIWLHFANVTFEAFLKYRKTNFQLKALRDGFTDCRLPRCYGKMTGTNSTWLVPIQLEETFWKISKNTTVKFVYRCVSQTRTFWNCFKKVVFELSLYLEKKNHESNDFSMILSNPSSFFIAWRSTCSEIFWIFYKKQQSKTAWQKFSLVMLPV